MLVVDFSFTGHPHQFFIISTGTISRSQPFLGQPIKILPFISTLYLQFQTAPFKHQCTEQWQTFSCFCGTDLLCFDFIIAVRRTFFFKTIQNQMKNICAVFLTTFDSLSLSQFLKKWKVCRISESRAWTFLRCAWDFSWGFSLTAKDQLAGFYLISVDICSEQGYKKWFLLD